MTGIGPIQERRRLNEEIESAFITAAQAAGNVDMKIVSGKGNVFPDFLDFYTQFNYLVRLTMRLKEMEPKEESEELKKLKEDILKWLHCKAGQSCGDEDHCRKGLKLFDNYYSELMHSGVISLPTRRG